MKDGVRQGRLSWFGHLECTSVDDRVSACRNVEVAEDPEVRCRSRRTWRECVNDDKKELGLHPEWAIFRDNVEGLHMGKPGGNGRFQNK